MVMGRALANEMLMFDKKLTAKEAKEAGLVSEVFPKVALFEEVRHDYFNFTEEIIC